MPRHQKAALLKEHRRTLLLQGRNVFSAAILDETLDKTACAYFEGIFLNIVQIYPLQIIAPPPLESMLLCLQKSALALGVCAKQR